MQTQERYYQDQALTEIKTKISRLTTIDEKTALGFDETIYYPGGGGQACDLGTLSYQNNTYLLKKVIRVEDKIWHLLDEDLIIFNVGDDITLHLDLARRNLNCQLHTAGHLIQRAVSDLKLPLTPIKGYHFPDGPYVEYLGDGLDQEQVKSKLQEQINHYLQNPEKVETFDCTQDELAKICAYVPPNLPSNKKIRVAKIGNFALPCGGLHVSNLQEIQAITIEKIKSKKGNLRIRYKIK